MFCFEKTANQWERDKFRVAERSKKRAHTSYSSSAPDRNSHSAGYGKGKSSKKTKSSSGLQVIAIPQVATVTIHCDGCGKLNHKEPSRLQQERTMDWMLQLQKDRRATSHQWHVAPASMLRYNFRAGSSTMIGRESASDTRPAQVSSSSSRYGPSDPRPSAREATRDNTKVNGA